MREKYSNTKKHIEDSLQKSELFQEHCRRTAEQLNIAPEVVEDVLKHLSFETLYQINESIISGNPIEVLIVGWLKLRAFQNHFIFKFQKIKKQWKHKRINR